jgi:hypothetical protein
MQRTSRRAAFTTDEITRLMLVCHEKSWEGGIDAAGQEHNSAWEHIGAQVESLLHYRVCCGCLALVHEGDRESHPCQCLCNTPLVESVGHHPSEQHEAYVAYTAVLPKVETGWIAMCPCGWKSNRVNETEAWQLREEHRQKADQPAPPTARESAQEG